MEESRTPIRLRIVYERLDQFFGDYTENISKGGLFICSRSPLEEGTEVRIVLNSPGRPYMMSGVVTWRRLQADESGPSGMDVKLIWSDDEERARFERYVEHLMEETSTLPGDPAPPHTTDIR